MMAQKNSLIFVLLLAFSLTGCGLKGPLYQQPEQPNTSDQTSTEQAQAKPAEQQ